MSLTRRLPRRSGGWTLPSAALVVAVLAVTTATSGASLSGASSNAGNAFSADRPGRYLHAYSQATDPAGLTGYAVRAGSSPVVPAAAGVDATLAANLGGYKNTTASLSRLLVVSPASPLPAGVSSVTVRIALGADPATGLQPLTSVTFAPAGGTGTCGGTSVTLVPGNRCQVNLTLTTVNRAGINGTGIQYVPTVYLLANFTGYAGSGLDYAVPVRVYDGAGPGPD